MAYGKHSFYQSSTSSSSSTYAEFKEILINIRLLQRTCDMANEPNLKPRKYCHLSLSEAQNHHRSLLPRMRELNAKISDAEYQQVCKEVEEEVAIIIEATSGYASMLGFGR
jgi:hypothetical protein